MTGTGVATPPARALPGNSIGERRSAWTQRSVPCRHTHYLVMAVLALLQALFRAEVPLGQDVLWGARWGIQVLDAGQLPRTDTYSWTAHGKAFIPNSWAWNVILGVDYRLLGVVGFWVLGGLLSLALALTTARMAARIGAPPLATIAIYAPVGMLGLEAVPRAQTVSNIAILLILPLLATILFAERRRMIRSFILLCALQIVWMNLHSAALIGPILVLVGGSGLLLSRPTARSRAALARLVAAAAAAALCCLLTPYGFVPITHAAEVRSASTGLVTEWAPAGFGSVAQALALLAVVGGAGLAWRVGRQGRGGAAACIAMLALCTASAVRFLPMLAVFAAPEIAVFVGGLRVRTRFLRFAVGLMLALLCLLAVLNLRDLRSLSPMVSPRLIERLPSGCRLLNDDLAGDAVVLLRPDVPVSLDGRNDMYGRQIIVGIENMFENRPGTAELLNKDRVTCVLGPSSMPLLRTLRRQPQWTVVGSDRIRTLVVRASGGSE